MRSAGEVLALADGVAEVARELPHAPHIWVRVAEAAHALEAEAGRRAILELRSQAEGRAA